MYYTVSCLPTQMTLVHKRALLSIEKNLVLAVVLVLESKGLYHHHQHTVLDVQGFHGKGVSNWWYFYRQAAESRLGIKFQRRVAELKLAAAC